MMTGIRASAAEKKRNLPGDAFLPGVDARITHAITINAPAAEVWPWLVQMGCNRAGWYSFDLLDNGGQPSATAIHPEWQHLAIGDHLTGSPHDEPDGGFEVIDFEPQRFLLLTTYNHLPGFEPVLPIDRPTRFWRTTWCFFLHPLPGNRTRLLARSNLHFRPRWLVYPLTQLLARPLHFFMQRKQLNGIKQRSEQTPPNEKKRALPHPVTFSIHHEN